jgi:hypothetical protein
MCYQFLFSEKLNKKINRKHFFFQKTIHAFFFAVGEQLFETAIFTGIIIKQMSLK